MPLSFLLYVSAKRGNTPSRPHLHARDTPGSGRRFRIAEVFLERGTLQGIFSCQSLTDERIVLVRGGDFNKSREISGSGIALFMTLSKRSNQTPSLCANML